MLKPHLAANVIRVILTILVLIFLTCSTKGQENSFRTKLIEELYTWRTVSSEQLDSFYFNLHPIQTTKFKSHFRISLTGQIIDFYSSDNLKYQGKLTNYTTEYIRFKNKDKDYDQSKGYQYVIEQIDLEQGKVDKVINNLFKTRQMEIPTDTLIASWQGVFLHCHSIVFQFNFNGKYTKQIFHCPWSQNDSVEFKNIILDNYQTLKSSFQLDSLYDVFESNLPTGKTYSRDGYRMIYKMTDEQSENLKKTQPQRDYMKSIKDTIDNYLNSELKKQKIELNGISCFMDYRLNFGVNGKLKRVYIPDYYKPKLANSLGLGGFLAEIREIRKCKRKIKQIFNEIDLSFIGSKHEFYRTFNIDEYGFTLRDDTIYSQ
jgi:hypothetical protein